METGCLFKVMVFVLALLALPMILFAQDEQEEIVQESAIINKFSDLLSWGESPEEEIDQTEKFEKFVKEFPEAKLPFSISVKDLETISKESENKQIYDEYVTIYHPIHNAMFSRSGGRTSYYFVNKVLTQGKFTAVIIEEREWRQAQADYYLAVFDNQGNMTTERVVARNTYDMFKTCDINEAGEITVTSYTKVRSDENLYDWENYDKLEKSGTMYYKIDANGKLKNFEPETVTGSIKK